MNILFITSALNRGGAERQWRTLLPALADAGRTVSLLTLQGRGAFFEEIDASGIAAQCAELRSRWDLLRIVRAVRTAPRADVVVAQGVDALVVASLVSARAGAPLVAVEHGGRDLGRRVHRRLLTTIASRRVERLVAVSASQVDGLRGLGYRVRNVMVIPNGVEPATAKRSRALVRAELGFDEDAFLVAFVGGLRPPKQPEAFVRALATPELAQLHVGGVVVGDGPLRPAVEEAGRTADGRVRVLGEREDVADILGASDAACLVSGTEALPMAVLEAMSAGLPVVATDVGGVADAVVDMETGLLVAPSDAASLTAALARLARDPSEAAKLGAAGRQRWERLFSARTMVAAYADLLDDLGGAG
jgi:glycosyltransferase involved in cell wall biosynthesis